MNIRLRGLASVKGQARAPLATVILACHQRWGHKQVLCEAVLDRGQQQRQAQRFIPRSTIARQVRVRLTLTSDLHQSRLLIAIMIYSVCRVQHKTPARTDWVAKAILLQAHQSLRQRRALHMMSGALLRTIHRRCFHILQFFNPSWLLMSPPEYHCPQHQLSNLTSQSELLLILTVMTMTSLQGEHKTLLIVIELIMLILQL